LALTPNPMHDLPNFVVNSGTSAATAQRRREGQQQQGAVAAATSPPPDLVGGEAAATVEPSPPPNPAGLGSGNDGAAGTTAAGSPRAAVSTPKSPTLFFACGCLM
jgi:hypothetical protein